MKRKKQIKERMIPTGRAKRGSTAFIDRLFRGTVWGCFILSVFSILGSDGGATATVGGIDICAQVTDTERLTGTFSGRFQIDYRDVDLYIAAYLPSEPEAADGERLLFLQASGNEENEDVKEICPESPDLMPWGWTQDISPLGRDEQIISGKWGTLTCVDYSPFKAQLSKVVFILLLVKQGEDPFARSNWQDHAFTSLITDPHARVPGQTLFFSGNDVYRDYPATLDVVPEANDGDEPADDDKESEDGDVEKPDIFKISGDQLYYANGSADKFQVIDISNPEQPEMRHSQRLEGMPVDLYVKDGYVILLEQKSDSDEIGISLQVFQDAGTSIAQVAAQSYSDLQYLNSRRSGDRLFITATTASMVYPEIAVDDAVMPYSEPSTVVVAVGIESPNSPELLAKETLTGYDADIYLDGNHMVQIARESWQSTVLHIFDLNAEDGPLSRSTAVKIDGRIPSEYHVKISDDTLFVIYRDENLENGSTLKIFDLSSTGNGDGDEVAGNSVSNADGDLIARERGVVKEIAPGEELYAATFMDDRAYIVTYERTDPLWVVDISDLDAPKILGELEVPGWSEYIRFHNDRLIALGYDDSDGKRRVSVALFSVEDPFNPKLLDRVTPLKHVADYTSSVAVSDDRGFYFNSSSGVILLPIQYYASQSTSGLEIIRIDSDYDGFQWDHFVQARFHVQRGTEADSAASEEANGLADIVISMGDSAINTIDVVGVSSSKKPEVLGELRLAYNVDKIALTTDDQTLFGVGGDYYLSSTSDLMRFDLTGGAAFQETPMDIPEEVLDSELSYPELMISKTTNEFGAEGESDDEGRRENGILFSWNDSAFRCFDPEDMSLGTIIKFDNTNRWMSSEPLFRDNHLYFSISEYVPIPLIDEGDVDDTYDRYGTTTTLRGFDCTTFDAPEKLPDLSIPGTPVALLENRKLVTVEQQDYYYPYLLYEGGVDVQADTEAVETVESDNDVNQNTNTDEAPSTTIADSDEPFAPEPIERGLRINVLDVSDDQAVLDATAFFDRDTLGYSQVICDESSIYLISWENENTKIRLLDPASLRVVVSHRVEGQLSPVKASSGTVVFTNAMVYPYYYDTYLPYWSQTEVRVLEFSGDEMKTVMADSIDYYLTKYTLEIGENMLYVANGYKGIQVLPFH